MTATMTTDSQSSNVQIKSLAAHNTALTRRWEAMIPENYLKVYLKPADNSASETPRTTSRPRITRGEPISSSTTPKPNTCTSQPSSFLDANTPIADHPDPVFADCQSGVIFASGLIRATGDRVTVREFCKAQGLATTLHIVIPPSPSPPTSHPATATTPTTSHSNEQPPLPSFALTLASPITAPHSPIHLPTLPSRSFTRQSYYKEISRAPRHMRIPYFPQYCAHTLRPYVPPSNCALCAIQLLACETWWNSRNPKHHHDNMASLPAARTGLKRLLCAPQVLPADCTPTTRSVYYALGLPLGKLDESCIDWDVVDAIMFIQCRLPRRPHIRQIPAVAFQRPSPSSSSRIRVLFRRARRFFSTRR